MLLMALPILAMVTYFAARPGSCSDRPDKLST